MYALLLNPFEPLIAPEVTSFFSLGGGGSSSSSWLNTLCLGPLDYNARSFIKLAVPVVAFLCHRANYVVRLLIMVCCQNADHKKRFQLRLYYGRTNVALAMLTHSSWLQLGLASLPWACIDAGAAGSFYAASPDPPCIVDTSRALFIAVGLCMCLWPFVVGMFLRSKAAGMHSRATDKTYDIDDPFVIEYGPLFQNFKPRRYWWIVVVIVRQSVLIAFYTLFFQDDTYRVISMTSMNILIFIVHLLAQPYVHRHDNVIEFFFLFALSLLASPSLFYQCIVLAVTVGALFVWLLWKVQGSALTPPPPFTDSGACLYRSIV
jgi:hypothetical protein